MEDKFEKSLTLLEKCIDSLESEYHHSVSEMYQAREQAKKMKIQKMEEEEKQSAVEQISEQIQQLQDSLSQQIEEKSFMENQPDSGENWEEELRKISERLDNIEKKLTPPETEQPDRNSEFEKIFQRLDSIEKKLNRPEPRQIDWSVEFDDVTDKLNDLEEKINSFQNEEIVRNIQILAELLENHVKKYNLFVEEMEEKLLSRPEAEESTEKNSAPQERPEEFRLIFDKVESISSELSGKIEELRQLYESQNQLIRELTNQIENAPNSPFLNFVPKKPKNRK